MKRSELKPGDIFVFEDTAYTTRIVDWRDNRFATSTTKISARLGDPVKLLGTNGELFTEKQMKTEKPLDAHYAAMTPEPVNVIESWGYDKNWYRANAIAYLARAGKKAGCPAEDDLLKAITFIVREVTAARGEASWDAKKL